MPKSSNIMQLICKQDFPKWVAFFAGVSLLTLLYQSSATASDMAVDDGQNSGVWKQIPSATSFMSKSAVVRSLNESGLLSNIHDVRLDGITTSISGNLITLHNLRVLSDTTDLNDYLTIDFIIDVESLRLVPVVMEITPELGVYYRDEDLFSKDVPSDIFMTALDGSLLPPDQLHTITARSEDEFTMFLEAGTVVSMRLKRPSDDYELHINKPDGRVYSISLYSENSDWLAFGRSILQSGVYTFRFVPQDNSTVTLQFGFHNNNRTALHDIVSGSNISVSLNGWGYEYVKYRLQLNAGDLVEITRPSDGDIWLYLVNSNSQVIASSRGEIFTRVFTDGAYYLFVQSKDFFNGSRYSGTVTIIPDQDRHSYPVLDTIPQQLANKGELYTLQLSASNAPTKYSATGLPLDVSIDETSGLISGTPTIAGTFPIRVTAKNEFGSDRQDFLLRVNEE